MATGVQVPFAHLKLAEFSATVGSPCVHDKATNKSQRNLFWVVMTRYDKSTDESNCHRLIISLLTAHPVLRNT